ncbi:fumarylacetoacetate hydrolase family protein [Crateriforma conspicua]|uniref:Fumarylacetoacetate (FAA) hydrolase family protein n=1 Tax=Crateriforma conspicua TaxID=2527996 RepID=A0A5C5Y462_9PLAN|nr:fumarylacetoacetate hydrolase family protein [Crateriforma conspicua]QDV64039.1 Fumarylacetoacetate (FAA) hydrolase family protein [Crateriforma conspicua]TWT69421.1 Fumarylacetoacetate (FAA) hydrolase family protein [Crateriforma conspicua]
MNERQFTVAKFIDDTGSVRIGRIDGNQLFPLTPTGSVKRLIDIIAADDPIGTASSLATESPVAIESVGQWLPPIDDQEVWAAGVTYKRSQTARMEESEAAASCYDRVYQADRPELFFKATPRRVSGHGQSVRIRKDATWNVPEPEVTLVISPAMKIVGLTVGNDMSSRDIEGENPLYLPQAKCYDQSAALGPWITLYDQLPPPAQIQVDLKIHRDGQIVFDQQTAADQMARGFEDLVGWLGRDNSFDDGAFLMTGTGIVPTSDFTLHPGDRIDISISGIGTLSNTVVQG